MSIMAIDRALVQEHANSFALSEHDLHAFHRRSGHMEWHRYDRSEVDMLTFKVHQVSSRFIFGLNLHTQLETHSWYVPSHRCFQEVQSYS